MQKYLYCPHCGAPLAEGIKFGRPRSFCRYCGFIHFRDPKVGVAALVTSGDQVLLVRRGVIPGIGRWGLPAGYMDADELPEEAVIREVAEETGIRIRLLGLAGVMPLAGWGERRGILLLYHAEPISGVLAAGDDARAVQWFAREDIPWKELAFESTERCLRQWAEGQGSVPLISGPVSQKLEELP